MQRHIRRSSVNISCGSFDIKILGMLGIVLKIHFMIGMCCVNITFKKVIHT